MVDSGNISPHRLANYLGNLGPDAQSAPPKPGSHDLVPTRMYYRSLMALASASTIYRELPGAKVSLNVITQPLHKALWVPPVFSTSQRKKPIELPRSQSYELDRAQVFACIVMFESSGFNANPKMLANVMALSSGNSIYIAKAMLCDPSERTKPCEIRRIIGNVGRPGIALLMPPQNPKVRILAIDEWNQINHTEFDGEAQNCLNHTSLHLSFTGYESPITLGSHGFQDAEVYLLESNVSVYDRGKWVSDLDIIRNLETGGKLIRVKSECADKLHAPSSSRQLSVKLRSIDSWEELLDPPLGAGIVRANGNWIGRLASTVVAIQKGHLVHVLEPTVCFECLQLRSLRNPKGKVKEDQRNDILVF